jgi:RNA polymerase sigma-70 factor (ECF subfamily)
MGRRNRYEGVDAYAAQLIRHKARRLVGVAGFVNGDIPDIEQELVLDVLARLERHDPRRSKRETFISNIVDHCIATLIEARKAGIRDYRQEAGSIDERVGDEDGKVGESASVVSNPAYTRKALAFAQRDQELQSLLVDVKKLLAGLPPEERALCERLKTERVAEISRETGVPRGTVYGQIERIRKRFEKAGLAVYLDSPDRLRRAPVGKERARNDAAPRSPRRRG